MRNYAKRFGKLTKAQEAKIDTAERWAIRAHILEKGVSGILMEYSPNGQELEVAIEAMKEASQLRKSRDTAMEEFESPRRRRVYIRRKTKRSRKK